MGYAVGFSAGIGIVPPLMFFGATIGMEASYYLETRDQAEKEALAGIGAIAAATFLVSVLDTSHFSIGIKVAAIFGNVLGGSFTGLARQAVTMSERRPNCRLNNSDFLNRMIISTAVGSIVATGATLIHPLVGCIAGSLSSYAVSTMSTAES